ncbi:MAG: autotransporter outer membrane beta-barrel domain-containing protein [Bacteroidota bacterium]
MLMLSFAGTATAQTQQGECSNVIALAQQDYQRGYFEEASIRLSECIRRDVLTEKQEKDAYLLLGQIYYANLELDKARDSVRILLERDPSIELKQEEHKRGFIDLVDEVMKEMNTETVESAPPPTRREGFWISVGIGPGEGNIRCDCPLGIDALISQDDPWKGGAAGSFSLSLGGTISPKLQVGAEINQWARSVEDNDRTSAIAVLTFIARYYPNATGNFFLKGGIGFGGATLENRIVKLQASGAALQFGLGYDIMLGRAKKVALTPFFNLNVLYVNEDVLIVDDIRLRGPTEPSYAQLGLAVTWP